METRSSAVFLGQGQEPPAQGEHGTTSHFPVSQLCSGKGTRSRASCEEAGPVHLSHTPFPVSEHLLCSRSCAPSKMDECLGSRVGLSQP